MCILLKFTLFRKKRYCIDKRKESIYNIYFICYLLVNLFPVSIHNYFNSLSTQVFIQWLYAFLLQKCITNYKSILFIVQIYLEQVVIKHSSNEVKHTWILIMHLSPIRNVFEKIDIRLKCLHFSYLFIFLYGKIFLLLQEILQ